jgi:hypothetical protein
MSSNFYVYDGLGRLKDFAKQMSSCSNCGGDKTPQRGLLRLGFIVAEGANSVEYIPFVR